ncbi:phosphatidylethanolamine-binding protein [Micromonospora sp. NPDC023956]|uniref:phosphatidylethanolamine-binding protein n=1 Tax=Micromonospora sp. NPDC023956 TaxID=3155722 RepID=UPI0033C7A5BA
MAGPRPGSNAYDKERARLRTLVENTGQAADDDANEVANRILRKEQGRRGVVRGERTFGPKGEREPGDPR